TIDLKTRSKLFKANAKSDLKIEKEQVNKSEIPWRYIYLCPTTVDIVGGDMAAFSRKPTYALTIPKSFSTKITNTSSDEEKQIIKELPEDIKKAIMLGKPILLPQDKTVVFHYKKNDWESWASPMTEAIFDDIMLLEK